MRTFSILLLPVLALLIGCYPAGPAPLSEETLKMFTESTRAFEAAAAANDWDAIGALYTTDAVLLPPNHGAVEGRENIRDFFATFPTITKFTLTDLEVDGSGDIAYVRGTYSMTMMISDLVTLEDHGKYLEIRKKGADGSWLLYRDMFSSDIPLPEPGE
jgi:ketosteroid isomerase-like protein